MRLTRADFSAPIYRIYHTLPGKLELGHCRRRKKGDIMATDYTKVLKSGEQNATPTAELVKRLGLKSSRALRKDISEARAEGQIILSSAHGGYYLPGSRQEIQKFVCTYEAWAKSIFRALRSARKLLDEIDGQCNMNMAKENERG